MPLLSRPYPRLLVLFCPCRACLRQFKSLAVSCTMQAQMKDAARDDLSQAAKKLAVAVQGGNVAAARALTIADVAAHFDAIANTIQQLAPKIAGATITIDSLYGLDASDLKAAQQTQFFCASSNAALHVEVSISQLPPGKYALALVHATGVQQPQQMAFLLMNNGSSWQLAGFFSRPLLIAGHDSVWYWTQARQFTQKHQQWNAYFFLTTAAYLSSPVDFLSSPNSEKLAQEQAAVDAARLAGSAAAGAEGEWSKLFDHRSAHGWLARRPGSGDSLHGNGYQRSGRDPGPQSGLDEGDVERPSGVAGRISWACGSLPMLHRSGPSGLSSQ